MSKIAKIEILESFNLTGRGLVILGNLLEGQVRIGSIITFDIGDKPITFKIGGVEMADSRSTHEYWVGLTFVYKDLNEMRE